MTEEQTLTPNESADLTQHFWSFVLVDAPETTDDVRETSGEEYIADTLLQEHGIHDVHSVWTQANLDSEKTLRLVDELRAHMKIVGDKALALAGLSKSPWRDVTEV